MRPKDLGIKYNRNDSSIIHKLQDLGMFVSSNNRWTKEEIKLLKEIYADNDWDYILSKINHSKNSITQKAFELGLSKESWLWSKEDVEVLKYGYKNKLSIKKICNLLNNKYTYWAVSTKAINIGLTESRCWTGTEITLMEQYYNIKSAMGMLDLLPNRSIEAIRTKAVELNLISPVYYTKEEELFIKNNWKSMTDFEISKYIHRTLRSVIWKRTELKLYRISDNSSYNTLSEYVRKNNLEWKNKSIQDCNFKCIISGNRFQDIHHLHGLNLILNETIEFLDFQLKENMDEYSPEELFNLLKYFRKIQDKYPLGVCLSREIHKQFHNIYGYGDNTPKQFEEFKINYYQQIA